MTSIFSPQAREDLKTIWHHHASEDFSRAVKYMIGMQAAIESLSESPEFGEYREDLGEAIFTSSHSDVTIYFQPQEEGIHILRIT